MRNQSRRMQQGRGVGDGRNSHLRLGSKQEGGCRAWPGAAETFTGSSSLQPRLRVAEKERGDSAEGKPGVMQRQKVEPAGVPKSWDPASPEPHWYQKRPLQHARARRHSRPLPPLSSVPLRSANVTASDFKSAGPALRGSRGSRPQGTSHEGPTERTPTASLSESLLVALPAAPGNHRSTLSRSGTVCIF